MSMRSAASCCQPLQESVVPRGARMIPRLVGVSMVESGIAVILLQRARVGQALLLVLCMTKGEQARVPVLLMARERSGRFGGQAEAVQFCRHFPDPVRGPRVPHAL